MSISAWEKYHYEKPNILVIGRGRCGTKAVAIALQRMGLEVRHEIIGENGSVNNEWALDVNGRPPLDGYTHVWHVVREPLAAIASMHTFAWTVNEADRNYNPRDGQLTSPGGGPAPLMPLAQKYWDDMRSRCAASYYEWNLECEKCLNEAAALGAHTWRFQIEGDWIGTMAKLLCLDPVEIPKDINTRAHSPKHPGKLEWPEVLANLEISDMAGLLEMADRYGYEAPYLRLSNGDNLGQ